MWYDGFKHSQYYLWDWSLCLSGSSDLWLFWFLQSHYTRAQANSPRPIMTSSGPNPKGSQGTLASQQHSQSQQSQQPASQSHHSPGGSGREQREQRNSRSSRRKGSDSSVPEEDKDRREETTGRGEGTHLQPLCRAESKMIYTVLACQGCLMLSCFHHIITVDFSGIFNNI